ncbi:MAG: ATP-binding protein, partial [Rhodanobacter sp.]
LEQVRRDFVANVSHELRTPLTVIHGYLELLDPADVPALAPVLGEMRLQSQRMRQIVEDLLTLSRLETGEALADEEVDMVPLLETLRREAEALSRGRHAITVDAHSHARLRGSIHHLHSAFSNLVSNAVRYTPSGGQIVIGWRKAADGTATFSVQDSGLGISEDHLIRLTERFYRVSSSRSRESGGTGLGLSIVKHVLNLHQGHLVIESEPGKGSTFSCVLDLSRVLPPEDDSIS